MMENELLNPYTIPGEEEGCGGDEIKYSQQKEIEEKKLKEEIRTLIQRAQVRTNQSPRKKPGEIEKNINF